MAEEAPAELVMVPTVGRIAEETLLEMGSHELEERTLVRHHPARNFAAFQVMEKLILRRFRGVSESHTIAGQANAIEQCQAAAIDR
jgi:hypothetical protein